VNHRFPQLAADRSFQPVVRTWVLEAADECPGSLAAIGWQRSEEDASAVADAIEQLRNSDELRKRESKSKREESQPDPFAASPP
ncbi:MAG TPA: hypothetical protein VG755_17975, partial [Nannocystaceae bacterium]|nr:hypothetical protein [Nannocystaceae bacterium]